MDYKPIIQEKNVEQRYKTVPHAVEVATDEVTVNQHLVYHRRVVTSSIVEHTYIHEFNCALRLKTSHLFE